MPAKRRPSLVEPGDPTRQYGRVLWRRTQSDDRARGTPSSRPQNLDAEESVLGAMMLSPGAIASVSEMPHDRRARVLPGEPREDLHARALGLYAKGEPVDAITLVDELDERSELEDVGGSVRACTSWRRSSRRRANAAHYARIVREMATLRGLIRGRRRDRAARLGAPRRDDRCSSTRPSRSSSTSRSSASRASSATSRSC